jgi:N,N'-diacetyllegionaminate synthase
MLTNALDIAGRKVGPGQPCFIIAEAGVNHNGSLVTARQLIDMAAEAGADAVKFQTFKAERLVTPDAPQAAYQAANTGSAEAQFSLLKRLELDVAAHQDLIAYCAERDILFLSTPFDEYSADLLVELGLPVLKISSGELTNLPFLRHVSSLGQPLIVSTGMATLGEVETAVETIRRTGAPPLALLHCVSNYPADPADVNLRAMATMAAAFGVPVGYSDHTLGIEVPLAAVALGACGVEKHFTLDRTLPGPDHKASLEPGELAAMVRGIRTVEAALGDGRKRPAPGEADTAAVVRKSLVAAQDIAAGETLVADMVAIKRPGTGLTPGLYEAVIGRRARVNIGAGTVLTWELLA